MADPQVVVTNYGAGENSVLVVNKAISLGISESGLLANCGDLTYKGSSDWQERASYMQKVAPLLVDYIETHGAPDIVVAQACFALEVFKVCLERCPDTIRVLQRDSTHARYWKNLIDGEMMREGLPARMGEDLVRREEAEYKLADRITVLSKWVERSFTAMQLKNKVRYVGRQVIDLPKWPAVPRPNDGMRFRVMVAGQLRVAKGTHQVCRAWRMMDPEPGEELVFSGFNTCEQGGDEWRLIEREMTITPRCRSLGWADLDKMPDRFASCDVYCLPSIQEGSSMTCVEAFASGRAVVATENSGSDILEENDGCVGLMVTVSDPAAIRDALNFYRHNSQTCIDHGIHGRQIAEQGGGVERFGEDYARAIRNIWAERQKIVEDRCLE